MRQPPTIDQIASLKCVQDEVLAKDGSCQYRPKERLPVWHTDGTFKETPEAGHAGLPHMIAHAWFTLWTSRGVQLARVPLPLEGLHGASGRHCTVLPPGTSLRWRDVFC